MKKLLLSFILPLVMNASANDILSSKVEAPFYAKQKVEDGFSNKMMILNSGVAAFWKRIEMIRNAKSHIEVEYFIYGLDETSKALTVELVKAAKNGVRVRILVDKSAAIFELDEFYAKALKEKGIELRYYNDATFFKLSSINFRNHRKLISVDDKYAITGGRNIENDYFDYSEEFNFMDRDVYVEGDVVKVMRESFDKFFENEITERPVLPVRPAPTRTVKRRQSGTTKLKEVTLSNAKVIKDYERKFNKAKAYVEMDDKTADLLANYEALGNQILVGKQMHSCPTTTFSTDAPGGKFLTRLFDHYGNQYRHLRKTLFDKAVNVDKKIVISSPYMINSPKSMEAYTALLKRNVEIELFTNSLASTDALYVAANLYFDIEKWQKLGIKTYLHPGTYMDEGNGILVDVTKAKWGTHSKTQLYIYNDKSLNEFMIGTYNYDNRSNHYNTEMGLFCQGSDELFAEVSGNIQSRMNESYFITDGPSAIDKNGKDVSIYGANEDDLLMMRMIQIPSVLLQLLL